ncbi:hypothetical protein A8709_26510 [Paenibacillus pectinilyticus]|uniref:Uncharacterized protein n=1 Tax=Paenibacillus pectinilyticus TaxID=512399 RepID=A0A1C1A1H5_9BACL|nr:hypothetical protein [Paenibacillus pectinilyticus]OCT14373.1 hypothetical protein A8709_26510 [Paenibacillus pectinilyticus]
MNNIPNIIVAACSDGILIAHKDKTNQIKEILGQLSQSPMLGSYQVGIKHRIKAVTNLELKEVLLGDELVLEEITRFTINW